MRRLVGDLLLLARADAKRVQPHHSTELDEVLTEAVSRLAGLKTADALRPAEAAS